MTQSGLITDALSATDARLLIVAPHPDDESLATGGLIQVALAHGAGVSVVVLTDGEQNPWPQCAAEHRLRISADDMARWGARRRGEARHALAILGVPELSTSYFGLPDLGLTDRLANAPHDAVAALRTTLDSVRPTLVVAPALNDRHPDHSAAHVMVRVALAATGTAARFLSYVVHGSGGTRDAECALDEKMQARKLNAVAAHASQLILSRTRMLRYANRPEHFTVEKSDVSQLRRAELRLPWRVSRLTASLADLTVVTRDCAWVVDVRTNGNARRDDAPDCVRHSDGTLWLRLPESAATALPIFARLSARIRSPWIYDTWGWTNVSTDDEG